MLRTIINKNTYQDSVVLMLLTNKISTIEGVNKVSIMMGTPANKEIFANSGLGTKELDKATANDIVIVIDAENEIIVENVLAEMEEFLTSQSKTKESNSEKSIKSWEAALKELPDANMALISVPGVYAANVANRALDENLNVFIFSDNVKKEDELMLKEKASEKGLLCMGPDCGTGVINSVPIAFTNNIKPGKIGIVGASGTGIQEVTTIIDRLGEGVTNAIGTGGRDLSEEIGGITMLSAIANLAKDKNTEVITIISKPPAEAIRNKIMNYLRTINKPIVTIFLGEKPLFHEKDLYHAYTLEETARISVSLLRNEEVKPYRKDNSISVEQDKNKQATIKAYYSGGTLAGEAAMLIKGALNSGEKIENKAGYMLHKDGFEVIDLGDDEYTQGKPHPMIDPTTRAQYMAMAMEDKSTEVILFDLVLGYGSHEDMASALARPIKNLKAQAKEENRTIHFVTTICGTYNDPQDYHKQKRIMEEIGVIVCDTNNIAVEKALALIGKTIDYPVKEIREKEAINESIEIDSSDKIHKLITSEPKIINIGLSSFSDTLKQFPCQVVQYDWKPIAGGDSEMIKVLDFLRGYKY